MLKGKSIKKVTSLLLALLLLCLPLSSCVSLRSGDEDYLTKEELDEILQNRLDGNVTVEGGDIFNVTVDGASQSQLVAASHALLSSVSVVCEFDVSGGYYPSKLESKGSGVIIAMSDERDDALIVTNYHVVYEHSSQTSDGISNDITVYLYGMESEQYAIPATYVGGSMNYDLAVLRVDSSRVLASGSAKAVTFADSNDVAVLDTAIAIGNAAGEGISATVGHVNVESEEIVISFLAGSYAKQVPLRVMRIDTAVNSGNSGGGLFNERGELIGIVNAKSSNTSYDNIGYAIPSNVVKYIADNIIDYCLDSDKSSVYRCVMGINVGAAEQYTTLDVETGKVYRCERVAVTAVQSGSLADGELRVGDLINSITIDGVGYEVTRTYHIVDVMLNARVGSTVEIDITRDGADMTVELVIPEDTLTEY